MKQKKFFVLAIVLSVSLTGFGQKGYTVNEQKEVNLFFEFKNYLVKAIDQKIDISDSSNLDYMLHHFFFINLKADSGGQVDFNEIPSEKMNYLKKSVNQFYNYFVNNKNEKLAENITAVPVGIRTDSFISKNFNSFQKANTLVYFDKRHPGKILGYILFIPATKDVNSQTKIWSWSLGFKFGKFYFTSLLGEEGYEYMFDKE